MGEDQSNAIQRLMQGKTHWTDDAACHGDERFTAREPDEAVKTEMASICASCPVLAQCRREHDFPDVIEVFVAGEWRK